MQGYKLAWGIWNFQHSITSRDTGRPEIYTTIYELNKELVEKRKDYYSMGYELWFTRITEVEITACKCGKMKEKDSHCGNCGE